jgi:hypothetical protein
MYKYYVALAALLIFSLSSPISVPYAQIAPGDVELPTGDVWPSQGERNYIPQEGLVPSIVNDGANALPSREAAAPNSNNTPSQHPPNNALSLPRIDTPFGRNCAPQHVLPADTAEVCDSLPYKRHRPRRPADAR